MRMRKFFIFFLFSFILTTSVFSEEILDFPGKIVFTSNRIDKKPQIYVLEKARMRKISDGGGNPRWSPDGKLIALVRTNKQLRGIAILNDKGEVIKQYPTDPLPFMVDWLPDGNSIVYCSSKYDFRNWDPKTRKAEAKEPPNIYRLSLKDGSIQQLTFFEDGKNIYSLDVSPRGDKIIFSRSFVTVVKNIEKERESYIANIDGSGLQKLQIVSLDARWDATGTKVVYSTPFFEGKKLEHNILCTYDFKTSVETVLRSEERSGFHPVFSKDGKSVLLSGWSGLYILNVETKELKTVLPPQKISFRASSSDTSPDWYQGP